MSAAGHEFPAAPGDREARWAWLPFSGVGLLGLVVAGPAGFVVLVPALLAVAADLARKPVGYAVTGDTLTVRRRAAPPLRYRLTGAVERVGPEAVGRLWGRRVPGAYVGASGTAAEGGRTRHHLTDRGKAVRAEIQDGAVIVSPRDPDAFVAMAEQR